MQALKWGVVNLHAVTASRSNKMTPLLIDDDDDSCETPRLVVIYRGLEGRSEVNVGGALKVIGSQVMDVPLSDLPNDKGIHVNKLLDCRYESNAMRHPPSRCMATISDQEQNNL